MNNQQEIPARGGNENAKDLMSSLLGTFRDSKSMSKIVVPILRGLKQMVKERQNIQPAYLLEKLLVESSLCLLSM